MYQCGRPGPPPGYARQRGRRGRCRVAGAGAMSARPSPGRRIWTQVCCRGRAGSGRYGHQCGKGRRQM